MVKVCNKGISGWMEGRKCPTVRMLEHWECFPERLWNLLCLEVDEIRALSRHILTSFEIRLVRRRRLNS